MELQLIVRLFCIFVLFQGTHSWCKVCPRMSNESSILCDCEDAYYDEPTGECVNYFGCSMFKSTLDSEIVNSLLSTASDAVTSALISNSLDDLAESNLTNLTRVISTLPMKLILFGELIPEQVTNATKDIDVINDIIKKRLLEVNHKLADTISPLFNPYVLRNKKLQKACNESIICIVQKVISKHQKTVVNATGLMLTDTLDQMIIIMDDIRNYYVNHCKEGCPLIRTVINSEDIITETVTNLKQYSDAFGKNIVNLIIHPNPIVNKIFDSILSDVKM